MKTDINNFKNEHKKENLGKETVKQWCDKQIDVISAAYNAYTQGDRDLNSMTKWKGDFVSYIPKVNDYISKLKKAETDVVSDVDTFKGGL